MSTGQIIIIGLGAILILSSLDFGSLFKTALENSKPPVKPINPIAPNKTYELVTLVEKWSDLKDACQKNGLTEAVSKLDEIFPTLIKTDK